MSHSLVVCICKLRALTACAFPLRNLSCEYFDTGFPAERGFDSGGIDYMGIAAPEDTPAAVPRARGR